MILIDTDEDALRHVSGELELKSVPFTMERTRSSQPPAIKGSYSQVGFSYKGDGNEETHAIDSEEDEEDDEEDDDKDISSDDSNDEGMEIIAKDFGIRRYNWLVYMDKKAKEEEKRQKEVIRGDPSIRKLSRKERRKASQMEREREREAARMLGRPPHHDPYRESRRSPTYETYPYSRSPFGRSRSRSRSHSPGYSRRHDRGTHVDNGNRDKSKPPKIEYITEFGGPADVNDQKLGAVSPPSSPLHDVASNRTPGSRILEALHVDPASALSVENDKGAKLPRNINSSTGIGKLNKTVPGGFLKSEQVEKKETPQERLKRIMNKQLNKQIRKDSVAEMAKKREQERQRQEKSQKQVDYVVIGIIVIAEAEAEAVLHQGGAGIAAAKAEVQGDTIHDRNLAPDLGPHHAGLEVDQDTDLLLQSIWRILQPVRQACEFCQMALRPCIPVPLLCYLQCE
ncbi:hypothetical protein HPP92_004074 [Vanilla planifolia]|uniref:Suppressor of white apricot N-terminal domain-containing protein n=1 Tax=Vanilla planifolia TaxID=51239 RepID=A0A835S8R5_VANPL|nr:hypothetical protein HPP92_004074 [Vanilla planifolia]